MGEGDLIAEPVPLPATAPRDAQRFTLSGLPGRWRLAPDQPSRAACDITRRRGPGSTLATLGERIAEFERDPGSEA